MLRGSFFQLIEEVGCAPLSRKRKLLFRINHFFSEGFFLVLSFHDQKIPIICVRRPDALFHELQHFTDYLIDNTSFKEDARSGYLLGRIFTWALLEMIASGTITTAAAFKLLLFDKIIGGLVNSYLDSNQALLLTVAFLSATGVSLVSGARYNNLPHEKRANQRAE